MILSFANQKGGVAKTTTCVNVAHGLARAGHSVLVIDMDPQANATFAMLGAQEPPHNVYNVLVGDLPIAQAITPTKAQNLSLIASEIELAGAEIELAQMIGGQTLLASKVKDLAGYDYILIDSPPSLGLLTVNSIAAAHGVIIPVSTGVFALKGIAQLERTIGTVRDRLNRSDLIIFGIVCTLYDHTNVAKDVIEAIRDRFGATVFNTIIPKNVRIEEAHSRAVSVFEWAADSTGAEAYQSLVEEIIDRG